MSDDGADVFCCGFYWLYGCIIKDVFHDFREDFKIGLLILISRIKGFCREGDEFIDCFHDILGIVSILFVLNVDAIVSEEVEFIVFAVIDLWDFVFDSFAGPVAAVLGVFVHDVIEYFEGLEVDKFHEFYSVFERKVVIFFEEFFDVEHDVFGCIIFGFVECEFFLFELVECDGGDDFYYIDEPISDFF